MANFPDGQVVGQVVPSRNLDPEQLRHSVASGPVQVPHSEWHTSQVLVAVFAYFPAGQVSKQLVLFKNLIPVQLRQLAFEAALHVRHSVWQASHVFVALFSNTFVATQAVGHVVPSRYLPVGQERH